MHLTFIEKIPYKYGSKEVVLIEKELDVYIKVTDKVIKNPESLNIPRALAERSSLSFAHDRDQFLTYKPNDFTLNVVTRNPVLGKSPDFFTDLSGKNYPVYTLKEIDQDIFNESMGFIDKDDDFVSRVPKDTYILLGKFKTGITIDGEFAFARIAPEKYRIEFSTEEKKKLLDFLTERKNSPGGITDLDYLIISNSYYKGKFRVFKCELDAIFTEEEVVDLKTKDGFLFHSHLTIEDARGTQLTEPMQLEYKYKYAKSRLNGVKGGKTYYASLAENYRNYLDTGKIVSISKTSVVL